jgi:signal transduction histidine kinase
MPDQAKIIELGVELAKLIDTLPAEEKEHLQNGIAGLVHDLRQTIGIIYTADSLLQRRTDINPEEAELLQAIDRASKRAVSILSDFSTPFDR